MPPMNFICHGCTFIVLSKCPAHSSSPSIFSLASDDQRTYRAVSTSPSTTSSSASEQDTAVQIINIPSASDEHHHPPTDNQSSTILPHLNTQLITAEPPQIDLSIPRPQLLDDILHALRLQFLKDRMNEHGIGDKYIFCVQVQTSSHANDTVTSIILPSRVRKSPVAFSQALVHEPRIINIEELETSDESDVEPEHSLLGSSVGTPTSSTQDSNDVPSSSLSYKTAETHFDSPFPNHETPKVDFRAHDTSLALIESNEMPVLPDNDSQPTAIMTVDDQHQLMFRAVEAMAINPTTVLPGQESETLTVTSPQPVTTTFLELTSNVMNDHPIDTPHHPKEPLGATINRSGGKSNNTLQPLRIIAEQRSDTTSLTRRRHTYPLFPQFLPLMDLLSITNELHPVLVADLKTFQTDNHPNSITALAQQAFSLNTTNFPEYRAGRKRPIIGHDATPLTFETREPAGVLTFVPTQDQGCNTDETPSEMTTPLMDVLKFMLVALFVLTLSVMISLWTGQLQC